MNSNTTATATSTKGGVSLVTIGFIVSLVLLVLKLTGVANLSWFWVAAPFVGSIAFSLALLVLFLVLGLITLGVVAIVKSKK